MCAKGERRWVSAVDTLLVQGRRERGEERAMANEAIKASVE